MSDHPNRQRHVEPNAEPVDADASKGSAVALLGILGMRCPRCAARVRNSLLHRPGVFRAAVDLTRGLVRASYDPRRAEVSDLLATVEAAGSDGWHNYRATLI